MPKKTFLVILLLLLVSVGVAMYWSSQQTSPPPETPPVASEANITGKKVSFTVTEGAHKKWTIDAAQGVYFDDGTGAKLTTVTGTFFDLAGKPTMNFKAPKGEYNTKDQAVKLDGPVAMNSVESVESDKGMHLEANKVSWSAQSKIVTATGGVTVQQAKMGTSKAATCRFGLDMSNISLEGGVTTQMGL